MATANSSEMGTMRDPQIHVQNGYGGMSLAEVRGIIVEVTGRTPDTPKTVGTGCGRRRPYAMTSTVPEHVTCLACRERAWGEQVKLAETADLAAELVTTDSSLSRTSPAEFADIASGHRTMAARYGR
jgi:hypothetical protein